MKRTHELLDEPYENTKASAITETTKKEKVARLDTLIKKSETYSLFLQDQLKKLREVQGLEQPDMIQGTMRQYQLVGVQWLRGLFENGLNGILGDEMGLGKTVQTIAFIAHLMSKGIVGPFLIACPLSTLSNWESEFKRWAPSINTLTYYGIRDERRTVFKEYASDITAFPVFITTYDIVMRDILYLRKIPWKFIIVDEGHRLKNMSCQLINDIKSLSPSAEKCNRLIITGTPLQNNLGELWSLLNFLVPGIFDDLESFQAWFSIDFSTSNKKEDSIQRELRDSVVAKLHRVLRPFLLRRLKENVDIKLPNKYEAVVYAHMTDWQLSVYHSSLLSFLSDSDGVSIRNIAMHLRKICNHPFLFSWPLLDGSEIVDSTIISASGKMVLLDRLLPALLQRGHRVLIFSQMTSVLDIIGDYLQMKKIDYCRFDGSTGRDERSDNIERFKRDNVEVFLLSTRSGGMGINLVSADTCIIFDSDWNPQVDLQAQDRCHRIGQTKPVMVYRFITRGTIEAKMMSSAQKKLKLEELVVRSGKFENVLNTKGAFSSDDALSFSDESPQETISNLPITDDELHQLLDRTGKFTSGANYTLKKCC